MVKPKKVFTYPDEHIFDSRKGLYGHKYKKPRDMFKIKRTLKTITINKIISRYRLFETLAENKNLSRSYSVVVGRSELDPGDRNDIHVLSLGCRSNITFLAAYLDWWIDLNNRELKITHMINYTRKHNEPGNAMMVFTLLGTLTYFYEMDYDNKIDSVYINGISDAGFHFWSRAFGYEVRGTGLLYSDLAAYKVKGTHSNYRIPFNLFEDFIERTWMYQTDYSTDLY